MKLSNLKKVKPFQLSERTKIDAQIGFTVGILVGSIAAFVFIMVTNWQWYFKLFSAIGSMGIIGSLALTLNELIKARKNYIETMNEMKKMNDEANKVVDEKTIEPVEMFKDEIEPGVSIDDLPEEIRLIHNNISQKDNNGGRRKKE